MSNELTTTEKQQIQVMPTSADEVLRIAQVISNGGFAPKGNDRPEQIIAAIHKGLEVGLSPMAAVQQIAVINGRPSLWGDSMIALVQASGQLADLKEDVTGDGENMVATCMVKRKGIESPKIVTFSAADAKTAGLWGKGGPWRSYPKRMLQLRARGFALRDMFADILNGLQLAEEQQDIIDAAWTEAADVAPVKIQLGAHETVEPELIEPNDLKTEGEALLDQPEPDPINQEETPDQKKLKDDAFLNAERGVDGFREWWKLISKQEQSYLKECGLLPILQETAQNA